MEKLVLQSHKADNLSFRGFRKTDRDRYEALRISSL